MRHDACPRMMKLAFTFGIVVLWMTSAHSNRDVSSARLPTAVQNTLLKSYPAAKIQNIEQEMRNGVVVYEVEASDNGHVTDVLLSTDGTIIETAEEIPEKDLPALVRKGLTRDHPDIAILEVERIVRGSETMFEMEVKVGGGISDVLYSADGIQLAGQDEDTGGDDSEEDN